MGFHLVIYAVRQQGLGTSDLGQRTITLQRNSAASGSRPRRLHTVIPQFLRFSRCTARDETILQLGDNRQHLKAQFAKVGDVKQAMPLYHSNGAAGCTFTKAFALVGENS